MQPTEPTTDAEVERLARALALGACLDLRWAGRRAWRRARVLLAEAAQPVTAWERLSLAALREPRR